MADPGTPAAAPARTAHPRFDSGVPGLDAVLCGGFLRGSTYILQGQPGVGKTTLAAQMCFRHVGAGGRALYVTLLAESHARLLSHLQSMSFFEPHAVGHALLFVSAFGELETGGLDALLTLLRREVRSHRATMLVLDGMSAVGDSAASPAALKRFVHGLQTHGDLAGCTTFLLTSAPDLHRPEFTMVDGLLRLRSAVSARRTTALLRVRKLRASPSLDGEHLYEISNAGVAVYPRIERLHRRPSEHEDPVLGTRVSTGVAGLDAMMHGGIPGGSKLLVAGPSGAGKTVLGVHFLAGASAAEPALHFGFFETPARLLHKADGLGLPLRARVEAGHVELVWNPLTEQNLDALGHQLLARVEARGVRRLLVDGMGGLLESSIHRSRVSHFFAALNHRLRTLGCTSMFTLEIPSPRRAPEVLAPGLSEGAENAVVMRLREERGQLVRVVNVLKVRESDFDPATRRFTITARGLQIAGVKKPAGRAKAAGKAKPARTRGRG